MKLWAKVIDGEYLRANVVVRNSLPLTQDNFEEVLREICHELDLSTPVTLASHFRHLAKFNIVEYKPRDFIEPVEFTKFAIENVDYD